MATWDDVRRIATSLPESEELAGRDGLATWRVRGRSFVWERPLRASDLVALGEDAPVGPVLGARVPDEAAKRALVADDPSVYFTTPHFDGYAAVLVALDEIEVDELEELIVESWLDRAPARLRATLRPAP